MAGLYTVLLTALCLAQTGSTHYSHSVRHSTSDWAWMDLWTQLILARKNFDRQESLLHRGQSGIHVPANLSHGLPTPLELASPADDAIWGRRERHQRTPGPSRRDQAVARAIGPYISPIANANISPACLDSTLAYLLNILNKQWALRMFDATGKMPDGIAEGNLNPFGNWDECLNTTARFAAADILGAEPNVTSFSGKYCLVSMSRTGARRPEALAVGAGLAPVPPRLPDGLVATVGVCMPSTCTGRELQLGLSAALRGRVAVDVPERTCYTSRDRRPLSAADAVMIAILALAGLFMLVGTTVDVVAVKAAQDSDSLWARVNSAVQRALPVLPRKVLLAFSVYTNGRKLLDTSSTGDTLGCLHGLRFLSNTWVILGHTYYFLKIFKHQNLAKAYSFYNSVAVSAIDNATVSVDSFFFLSGLLVSYISMRNMVKTKGRFNIIMFYVHRYIRLTPVMMIIIGFVATLYPHLGSGPAWGNASLLSPKFCQEKWWKNMLYLNNLLDLEGQCLGQTWYLANDMQMFIFSPLVLLPLYHWPKLGQLWIIFLVCFFTGINAMITAIHNIGPNGPLPGGDDVNLRYMKPWTRAGPYLVGLYMGWILHKIRGRKIRLPAPVVAIGWITASLTGCLIVYGTYDYSRLDAGHVDPSKTTSIVYGMLNRTAWSVCLAWVVFACVTGYGGFVNTLLSWEAFIPLSRLTYTSYLVSVDIQLYYWFTNKAPVHLDHTFLVYIFLSSSAVIFAVSTIFSLAFESPMIALEKIVFPPPPRGGVDSHNTTNGHKTAAVHNGQVNSSFQRDCSGEPHVGDNIMLPSASSSTQAGKTNTNEQKRPSEGHR